MRKNSSTTLREIKPTICIDKTNVVLVGGGHAHLYLIKKYAKQACPKIKLTLISSYDKQYYSGMASSFLEGVYNEEDFSFDLINICKNAGVEFIEGLATKIDYENKKVICSNSLEMPFDILSLDIGSEVAYQNVAGVKDFAITVKPLINLLSIKKMLDRKSEDDYSVVIVGGGAVGVELSLALRNYSNTLGKNIDIAIVEAGDSVLKTYSFKVINKTAEILKKNIIQVYSGETILKVEDKIVLTKNGSKIKYSILIWAVGISANSIFLNSNIPTDNNGYMLVNNFLQSQKYPFIFGAGDCIEFENFNYVKKVGVYAIKEAPVLWENILNYAQNKKLREYRPQKTFLSIISTGKKTAVLFNKGFVLSGKLAWLVKDIIDRSFISKFKNLK